VSWTSSGATDGNNSTSSWSTSSSATGATSFTTGALSGVTIGSDARGVFALAGNTGVGASQNALISINSEITGSSNSAFGGN
jgi:hypothetical protein